MAIYIEPTSGAITTDTARTRVKINKELAPWEDWAAEFKSKMPKDLAEFIESFDEGTRSSLDDLKAIRAKFKKYSHYTTSTDIARTRGETGSLTPSRIGDYQPLFLNLPRVIPPLIPAQTPSLPNPCLVS